MLILTRKINQKLIINDNIEIVILESYKNAVKIGVNAPNNVQIFREEVYREIKKSNSQAKTADINTISKLAPTSKGAEKQQKSFDLLKKIQKDDYQ